jgi:hypothetical protein
LALFYVLMVGKQRSMVKAHRGLDEIRWDALDWTPPKLVLANFRIKGKVCKDLTPLEAAFYLEIPFRQILSAMFNSLVGKDIWKCWPNSPPCGPRCCVRRKPDGHLRADVHPCLCQ